MEYEDGFGKLTGEFWYGLKALHCPTGQGGWGMRMDVTLTNGTNIFLQYKQFQVASTNDKYKLTVGEFQWTTSDLLSSLSGVYFTTKDRDNDRHIISNCALWSIETGGWWYYSCGSMWPNSNFRSNYGIYLNEKWDLFQFIGDQDSTK